MRRMKHGLSAFALAATLLFGAGRALAGGLAIAPAALSDTARADLSGQIAAYRAQRPDLFDAVKNVQGVRPEVYKRARKPAPEATRELRALGPAALLPMLEALAFDAPPGSRTEAESDAFAVGLLEAIGHLRDARSGPVVRAVLESAPKSAEVMRAAAEAVGKLCSDADLALLTKHTKPGDKMRDPATLGLGECRRPEAASTLASLMASAPDDASAEVTAKALGTIGSSWAWKAMGPGAHQPTGAEVRALAARALVDGFVKQKGQSRNRIAKSLTMLEETSTPKLIANARASADSETAAALDVLARRVQRSLAR